MSDGKLYRSQCLFRAFDEVSEKGGYICFGSSTKWPIQHAGNYDNLKNEFSAFVPPAPLSAPWRSLLGFDGSVVVGDQEYRKPMTPKLMWRGIKVLIIGFWIWRISRWIDTLRKKP